MKKLLTLTLIAALIITAAFALTACGDSDDSNNNGAESDTVSYENGTGTESDDAADSNDTTTGNDDTSAALLAFVENHPEIDADDFGDEVTVTVEGNAIVFTSEIPNDMAELEEMMGALGQEFNMVGMLNEMFDMFDDLFDEILEEMREETGVANASIIFRFVDESGSVILERSFG